MDLKQWMREHDVRRGDLATQLGVSEFTVSRLCGGTHTPSLPLAVKLERITGIPAANFAKAPS